MHLHLQGCALLLSNTMYLSLTESLYLLWDATSIHLLPLLPHVKSVVFALPSPLFPFFVFLSLFLFYSTSSAHFFPTTNSTQLNSTAFQLSFRLHFHSHFNSSPPLFITTYLHSMFPHSNNPTLSSINIITEATTPQANSNTHQQRGKWRLLHATHIFSILICTSFRAYHIAKYHLFQIYQRMSIPGLPGLVIMKTHTYQFLLFTVIYYAQRR